MRKTRHRALSIGKDYVVKSRLLEDIKAGKEPEKKHKTLDNFFDEFVSSVLIPE